MRTERPDPSDPSGQGERHGVHPMLRPGVQVVARGRDRLQVGLGERARVLPRDDRTRLALSVLGGDPSATAVPEPVRAIVTELERAGLTSDPDRERQRRRRRVAARVRVEGSLGVPAAPMLAALDAGVLPEGARTGPDAVLLLHPGELDRDLLDPLLRHRVPHLVVRALDGEVVLGPFVEPGRTACLSCLDAHRAERDREHPFVLARYARAGADVSSIDPMLATVATAWAVRDLVSWLEGDRPATWSATMAFGPTLREVTSATWLRHPECGCSWLEPSGTMAT